MPIVRTKQKKGETVEDQQVWFRVVGPEDAPAVLFINSLDTLSEFYRYQVEALQATRRCVIFDYVGRGASSTIAKKQRQDEENLARQALYVADWALGKDTKFSVVAHGMGAIVAMKMYMSMTERERVVSFTLLAPFGLTGSRTRRALKRCCCCMICCCCFNRWLRTFHNKRFTKPLMMERLEKMWHDYFQARNDNKLLVANYTKQVEREDKAFVKAVRKSYKHFRAAKPKWFPQALRMAGRNTEVLIMWGDDDKVLPNSTVHRFKPHLPKAMFELIANGGHVFFTERPPQTNKVIIAFLNQADPIPESQAEIDAKFEQLNRDLTEQGTARALLSKMWSAITTGTATEK